MPTKLIKMLPLTCQELLIVEAALKKEVSTNYHWLLLQIGAGLINKRDIEVGLEEADLWFLRDMIFPTSAAGRATGLDILLKIYTLLLEIEHQSLFEILNLREVPDARESEDKGDAGTDNSPESEPGQAVEPGTVMSKPEA